MKSARKHGNRSQLDRQLAGRGMRLTEQRREVYDVVVHELDHPTAQEVFLRAKLRVPDISLATVYNCLEALATCGLVRRVQVDPAAGRFCPNMNEHGHFYCESCGSIYDVAIRSRDLDRGAILPAGFETRRYDISLRGICSECAARAALKTPMD